MTEFFGLDSYMMTLTSSLATSHNPLRNIMRIIIIGAGFAGLSSTKVLKAFRHDVTIFEKEADVGGYGVRPVDIPA